MKKSIIVLICLLGLIIFVILKKPIEQYSSNNQENIPDYSFDNIVLTQFNDQNMEITISSKKADIFKEKEMIFLDDVSGNIKILEKKVLTFIAKTSQCSLNHSNLILNKSELTYFKTTHPLKFNSNYLNWNLNEKSFIGKSNILITQNNIKILGDYFEFNMKKNKLLIKKGAEIHVEIN
ncbi:LPS export ABC transporter periplasmic protein LptC [Candidatus Marinamargulisbacteria bacterium SCGC AG-410-N11]|nr:LPS export ABC transporter periplasmic protein LptC [Candidatus Marinamargulisbacteria bacterium SCGC AG-410-N11]